MADVSDEEIRRQIGAIMSMSDEIDGDVMLKCLTELQARRAAEAKAVEVDLPDYLRFGEPDMFPPAQK